MTEVASAQENPLLEGLTMRRPPDPCALTIFGASGDLTQRKIMPALYSLAFRRLLPERSRGLLGLHTVNRAGALTVVDAYTRRRRFA